MFASLPKRKLVQVLANQTIDDERVALSRLNKLKGTYGETIVIFHNEETALGQFVREIQKNIIAHFGEVKQCIELDEFVDEFGKKSGITGFSVIKQPHTTLSALRVVDAKDENTWNEKLIQSYLYAKFTEYQTKPDERIEISAAKEKILNCNTLDELFTDVSQDLIKKVLAIKEENPVKLREFIITQSHSSLLYARLEELILQNINQQPCITLHLDAIVLSPNGSLGIRWKKNDDIAALRKEFAKMGGIAKHGDDVITTTIGYFPYCNESSRLQIKKIMEDIVRKNNIVQRDFVINLKDAQLVKFSRNDLHPDFIKASKMISNDHLSSQFANVDFKP